MKILIISFLGIIFTASAAEYGWLRGGNGENLVGKSTSSTFSRHCYSVIKDLVLNEGDSLTFVSSSGSYFELYSTGPGQEVLPDFSNATGYFWSDGSHTGTPMTVVIKVDSQYVPLESRTLFGPLVIVGIKNEGYNAQYRINRSTDPDGTEKFSVSLDNDGDRVAVGYKENGTNSVVKVYQFDGSLWNQLGDDIE